MIQNRVRPLFAAGGERFLLSCWGGLAISVMDKLGGIDGINLMPMGSTP